MLAFSRLTSSSLYLLPVPEPSSQIYNENAFIDFEATTAATNTTAAAISAASDQQFDNSTKSINNSTGDFDIGAGTNKTAVISNELDLKYSLMFIIDFQVILFNALIIAHLLKAKSFQKSSSARYFVLSLAVSDVLVGILVMPLGIVSLISNTWLFGKLWCGKCVQWPWRNSSSDKIKISQKCFSSS